MNILEYFNDISSWSQSMDISGNKNKIIFCKLNPSYTINVNKKNISIRYNNMVIKEFCYSENYFYSYYSDDYGFGGELKINGFLPKDTVTLFDDGPTTIIRNSLRYKVFIIVNLIYHVRKLDVYHLIFFDRPIDDIKLNNAIEKIEVFFKEHDIKIISQTDPEAQQENQKENNTIQNIQSKGGVARHKLTNEIKNNIIKNMFCLIKGGSVAQKATKIVSIIADAIEKNTLNKMKKKYNIGVDITDEMINYLREDKYGQIYKWCLKFKNIQKL